jgi:hypothetical protein
MSPIPTKNARGRFERSETVTKSKLSCFKCGRLGHKQNACQDRRSSINRNFNTNVGNSSKIKAEGSSQRCSFCFKTGHVETHCFTKAAIEQRRNVNFISVGKTTTPTPITVDGRKFMGLIDTGVDVSLLSDKFAEIFSSKLKPHCVAIAGITSGNIFSKYHFQADVEITGQCTRLTFLVVPAENLDYDVIIGCDLFQNSQLAAVSDRNGTRVVNKQLPGVMRVVEDQLGSIVVPDEFADQIRSLLNNFSDLIATGLALPEVTNASMEINLIDNFIVTRRPYRLADSERVEVRKIITDLLSNGIIRESTSPYASPILLVRKKQGSYRMCVDFRELNAHTVKDKFPLPRIDDQLDRLGRGKYFTSLDMAVIVHFNYFWNFRVFSG